MFKTTLNSDSGREKSKAKDSMRYFNPKRDRVTKSAKRLSVNVPELHKNHSLDCVSTANIAPKWLVKQHWNLLKKKKNNNLKRK